MRRILGAVSPFPLKAYLTRRKKVRISFSHFAPSDTLSYIEKWISPEGTGERKQWSETE